MVDARHPIISDPTDPRRDSILFLDWLAARVINGGHVRLAAAIVIPDEGEPAVAWVGGLDNVQAEAVETLVRRLQDAEANEFLDLLVQAEEEAVESEESTS